MKKTTVITYGTFDLFHNGHLSLLKRARALGDRLVVGVSTDSFNKTKGKDSFFCLKDRVEILNALTCVDETFLEESWDQKQNDILRFSADLFVMGSDWIGEFDFLKDLCQIVYLPRTVGISTTSIKNRIDTSIKDEILNTSKKLSCLAEHLDNLARYNMSPK